MDGILQLGKSRSLRITIKFITIVVSDAAEIGHVGNHNRLVVVIKAVSPALQLTDGKVHF